VETIETENVVDDVARVRSVFIQSNVSVRVKKRKKNKKSGEFAKE
jgi:hypothetical protein